MRGMRWLFLVAVLSAAACLDDPTGSGASEGSGTLLLRLASPYADDGALLFELTGPGIDSVKAVNTTLRLFTRRASDATVVGAVLGPITNGAVVTVHVPKGRAPGSYTARLVDVADRQNALRATLTGYALTVGP